MRDATQRGTAARQLPNRRPLGRGVGLGCDERIVWVDVETFADYRSVYYRNGDVQKVIDKSCQATHPARAATRTAGRCLRVR